MEPIYLDYKTEFFPEEDQPVIIMRTTVQEFCPLHTHSFIELAYIEKGNGIHEVNNQRFQIQKGDFFVINPHIAHSFLPALGQNEVLTVINCIFHPEFIDYALLGCSDFLDAFYQFFFENFVISEGMEPGFISFHDNGATQFGPLFTKMLEEYNDQYPGWQSIIKSCLTMLIIQMFREIQKPLSKMQKLPNNSRRIVENTITYIQEHYKQDLRLETLAANVYLSPSYLSRLFKKYTSQTMTQFIRKERIEAVCHGLAVTEKSVELLADEAGYRDMKNFYDAFRQVTGTTPGEYRKKVQKNL